MPWARASPSPFIHPLPAAPANSRSVGARGGGTGARGTVLVKGTGFGMAKLVWGTVLDQSGTGARGTGSATLVGAVSKGA